MAWRFNETVPLVMTRREASEVYEALKLYINECGLDDVECGEISSVIERMKRHIETRRTTKGAQQ